MHRGLQLKGKAAIDVICNPLGKSGGALIQQFMIISFGSLAASTPYLGGILLVIVLLWMNSARSLDKQFTGGRLASARPLLPLSSVNLHLFTSSSETCRGPAVTLLPARLHVCLKYCCCTDPLRLLPDAELQVEQMRLKRQQEEKRTGSGRKYKFVSQLNDQGFIEGEPAVENVVTATAWLAC